MTVTKANLEPMEEILRCWVDTIDALPGQGEGTLEHSTEEQRKIDVLRAQHHALVLKVLALKKESHRPISRLKQDIGRAYLELEDAYQAIAHAPTSPSPLQNPKCSVRS